MSEFIDFELVPVDTLVEVKIRPDDHSQTAYFAGIIDPDYGFCVFPAGASSKTSIHKDTALTGHYFRRVRISDKNPWLPWFGGDCPVPPICLVEFKNTNKCTVTDLASNFNWEHGCRGFDFAGGVAYRMLESPWQTINGVCDE